MGEPFIQDPLILKVTIIIESDTERYIVEVPHAMNLYWTTKMEEERFNFLKQNDGKVRVVEIDKVEFSFKPLKDEETRIGVIERYEEKT